MNLREFRVVFFLGVAVVALFVASPALVRLLVYPQTGYFTAISILGPNHTAENYPNNIMRGQNYTIFLDLTNHLGYTAYYLVEVKFRNITQSAPTDPGLAVFAPSSLPSLYSFSFFLVDGGSWEMPLTFSFDYSNSSVSTLQMHSLTLNGFPLRIENCTISWDMLGKVFRGYLFFETWIYNRDTSAFNYHDRYVSLALNMNL